jgi:hypothetical protein
MELRGMDSINTASAMGYRRDEYLWADVRPKPTLVHISGTSVGLSVFPYIL